MAEAPAERPPWADEDDPISLEPLAELGYPAFDLPAARERGLGSPLSRAQAGPPQWFDAKVLSAYLVSTGSFTHPLSRRPVERAECLTLDTFIRRHRLGRPVVTTAYDHRPGAGEADAPAPVASGEGGGEQQQAERRAEATVLLTAIFEVGETGRRRAPAAEAAANLVVLDEDELIAEASEAPSVLDPADFPTLR